MVRKSGLVAVLLVLAACALPAWGQEVIWSSAHHGIASLDLQTGTHRAILPSAIMSFGVVADSSRSTFYYTAPRGIHRANALGTMVEPVLSIPFGDLLSPESPIAAPFDVWVNELNGDVYWGEGLYNPGNGWDLRGVRRFRPENGQIQEVLHLTDGTFPRVLQVDPPHDLIVVGTEPTYADDHRPDHGSVLKMALDGTGVTKLYDAQGSGIRGVSVATEQGRVFWGEYSSSAPPKGRIMVGSLDGTAPPRLLLDAAQPALSLGGSLEDLFYHPIEDKLYFGTSREIGRINVDGTGLEILLQEPIEGLLSFTVLDPSLALVPEPASAALLLVGLLTLVSRARRTLPR